MGHKYPENKVETRPAKEEKKTFCLIKNKNNEHSEQQEYLLLYWLVDQKQIKAITVIRFIWFRFDISFRSFRSSDSD